MQKQFLIIVAILVCIGLAAAASQGQTPLGTAFPYQGQLKNNGLPAPEPFAWRLARDKNGVLYLVVARRSEDGSFGNSADGALYRSSDGAEHWQRIRLPDGLNGPNGVAIDPEDPKRLYLAAWGRETPNGAVQVSKKGLLVIRLSGWTVPVRMLALLADFPGERGHSVASGAERRRDQHVLVEAAVY